jgi:dynein assembly factor 3
LFKYWRTKGDETFPASKCWDVRLRAYFGTRYDSRANAYDWDFAMKLTDRKNASIINNRIYSRWRESGVAYEIRDAAYDRANKTLASGAVFNDPRIGEKTSRRGYFGDILVGPFISYGIESADNDLFKKQNDTFKFTSLDVARANLNKLMEGIARLGGFQSNYEKLNFSSEAKIVEIAEEEKEKTESENEKSKTSEDSLDYLKLDNCKITFLPLSAIQDFVQKSKYDGFFDVVYFSNSGSVHMSKGLTKIFRPKSLVLFETARFMIEMKNEQINSFSERLKQIAQECNLVDLNKTDETKPTKNKDSSEQERVPIEPMDYFVFKFNGPSS